jgi:F0F1-type ATP synthase membrane subunit c/vacuolar-type H+-ATPase subunit K
VASSAPAWRSAAVPSVPPSAQGRLTTIMFLTVGLCEAAYFINLVFAALFVFSLGK